MQQEKLANVANVGGLPAAVAAPQAYVIEVQSTVVNTFNSKHSKTIGIVLLICAATGFIFNSVEIIVGVTQDYGGFFWGLACHGYWTGVSCAIAGGFAIGAARWKTKTQILMFNVFCIIAASLTCGQFVLGLLGAVSTGTDYCYDCYVRDVLIAMESLLVILSVVEAVVVIWGSILCCQSYCCCVATSQYYMQTVASNGTPTIVILDQPPTAGLSPMMGVSTFGYPQAQPLQLTVNLPNYSVYNNQENVSKDMTRLQQCPSANQTSDEKSKDADPSSYI